MIRLERFYLSIRDFLSNLINSLISIAKVVLLSKFNTVIPKVPAGKVASILGNGPSLKKTLEENTDFLKQTEVFCVNNFASSEAYEKIQPQNYVLLDPAFFLFSLQNDSRTDVKDTIAAITTKTHWAMSLFIPYKFRRSYLAQEVRKKNPKIQLIYFNYTVVSGFPALRHWLFKTNLGMPQCQNILAASLYLAITQKYADIYLMGADHSWHEEIRVTENNELEMKQVHFYDKPDAVKHLKIIDVRNNEQSKVYMQFQSLSKAFFSYEILKQYADYQGVKIWNASKKSYIDSFKRVNL